MSEDCIFCRIIAGDIPSKKVYEDEVCVAFHDVSPQAPVHILGHLLLTCGKIARDEGLAGDGYRVVINTGERGGQTVFHLHVHLLGGRQFVFPPG
jgi:histidine triad (HIT) family protein